MLDPNVLAALMLAITNFLGIAPVADLPAVVIVPQARLALQCGHCPGFYTRNVVLVSDAVAEGSDEWWQIVEHELVHHVQDMTGRYGTVPSEARWWRREYEARDYMEGYRD